MGTFRHRRSVRWLALTAAAAAAASGLSVLGGIGVRVAAASEFTFVNGDLITDGPTLEPVFVDGQTVGHFFDSGAGADCNVDRFTAIINWGDGAESPGTITCTPVILRPATTILPLLPEYNVSGGTHEYKDSGTYDITITVTDTTDHANEGAKTDSASVSDRTLYNDDGSNVKAIEGQTVTVTNFFYDNNQAYSCNSALDPGITATIDWGDGTTTKNVKPTPPPPSDGCSDFTVTGSHVYDAAAAQYQINITVSDDGGKTADLGEFPLFATISDAALTAGADKSLSETAGAISNGAVASFTDAAGAQASAADFSAVIDWGDKATSVGTVSHTGSGAAFDVSGAHGYATSGTKTITTTVTDQEGQSVTMKATVTVNAAPAPVAAALPTTGQPQQPSSPLPLALLILGAMAILGAGGTLLFRRTTR